MLFIKGWETVQCKNGTPQEQIAKTGRACTISEKVFAFRQVTLETWLSLTFGYYRYLLTPKPTFLYYKNVEWQCLLTLPHLIFHKYIVRFVTVTPWWHFKPPTVKILCGSFHISSTSSSPPTISNLVLNCHAVRSMYLKYILLLFPISLLNIEVTMEKNYRMVALLVSKWWPSKNSSVAPYTYGGLTREIFWKKKNQECSSDT